MSTTLAHYIHIQTNKNQQTKKYNYYQDISISMSPLKTAQSDHRVVNINLFFVTSIAHNGIIVFVFSSFGCPNPNVYKFFFTSMNYE